MKLDYKTYGSIRLLDIDTDKFDKWDENNTDYVRVRMPSNAENLIEMQKNGYLFADRTYRTLINLVRVNKDYEKNIRFPYEIRNDLKDTIFEIAKTSFPTDRRFNIFPELNSEIAEMVIHEWVNELDDALFCFYKEKPVAFLALKDISSSHSCIHLAAVLEKYRAAGVGAALYASAIKHCIENGYKTIEGRISSVNTSVFNLYSYFGAAVSEPIDIFIKEVR